MLNRIVVLLTLCALVGFSAPPSTLRARIDSMKTPDQCRTVLKDSQNESILRRIAFRKLLYSADTVAEAIELGMKDADLGIRSLAIYELYSREGDKSLSRLEPFLKDSSLEVGLVMAEVGRVMKDKNMAVAWMTKLMEHNKNTEVLKLASSCIGFSFHRDNVAYSDNPVHDHAIITLKSIPLPLKGWRFKIDPGNQGHQQKFQYFLPQLDDSKWTEIEVAKTWEEQNFEGYDGLAWYRLKFKMPEKIAGAAAVEISFGAVDEEAWIWLNGKYIGQHAEGPNGWKVPFKLDITKEINWGGENVLVVRVKDSEAAGGIWKPVTVEVVK